MNSKDKKRYVGYIDELGEVIYEKEGNVVFVILSPEQKQKIVSHFDTLISKLQELEENVLSKALRMDEQFRYLREQTMAQKEHFAGYDRIGIKSLKANLNHLDHISKTIKEFEDNVFMKIGKVITGILRTSIEIVKKTASTLKKIFEAILKTLENLAKGIEVLSGILPILLIGGIVFAGWIIYKVVKQPDKYVDFFKGVLLKSKT